MSYFYLVSVFSAIQMRNINKIKRQNRLIAQLTMWNDFEPVAIKRGFANSKETKTLIRHKRAKV